MEGILITIHLEAEEQSTLNIDCYWIKGWYYYDKYEKKIPLVVAMGDR
jgi:hypothetical protein